MPKLENDCTRLNKNKKKEGITRVIFLENCPLTRNGIRYSILKYQEKINILNEFSTCETLIEYLKLNNDKDLADIILIDLDFIQNINFAIESIKKIKPEIKILALSSNCSKDFVLQAFLSGVMAYCAKDISPEVLVKIIEKVAKGANSDMHLFCKN